MRAKDAGAEYAKLKRHLDEVIQIGHEPSVDEPDGRPRLTPIERDPAT